MCIAITKPIGVALPTESILKNCWINNDDGAGFAFNHNGRVFIKKGFMTFNAFMDALKKYDDMYNLKNAGMLLHFRIATHGAKDATMTHPFPIVADEGCLKKIEYTSDYAVIHNGIISLTSYDAKRSEGLSDTAIFIRDYLTKIAGNKSWLNKRCNIELIEELIESKMAILDKNGNIKMTSGFSKDHGIYYSNSSYNENYYKVFASAKSTGGSYYGSPYCIDYLDDYLYGDYDSNYYDGVQTNKSEFTVNGTVDMMQIPVGCIIEGNSFSEEVTDTDYNYFVDNNNNLYIEYVEECVGETETHYSYIDKCEVYDRNIKPIEFKKTITVDKSQID